MRIAVVGDAASINVRRWCEGLRAAGAAVGVVSAAGPWRDDIPVHRLPLGGRLAKAKYLVLAPFARRAVAVIRPDVIVGYFATGYGTLARLAGGRPLVQVTAGDDVLVTPPGTLAHRMATRNLREADLVVAWAPHMADAVRRFGVPEERILVQPRGIPLDGYAERRDPVPGTRLVCTRSLRREYHHEAILEALADPALAAVRLTVAGEGPERAALERRTAALGLGERVRFVGPVPNDTVPHVLADHDVYVSACERDGASASLLEAMAAGLVPVVARHPANAWWVEDGVTGLLVDQRAGGLVPALARATTDAALASAAADRNPRVVRERGDLHANMRAFVDAFAALARR